MWEARQLNPLPEVDGDVGEQLVGGAAGGQDQAEEEKGRETLPPTWLAVPLTIVVDALLHHKGQD